MRNLTFALLAALSLPFSHNPLFAQGDEDRQYLSEVLAPAAKKKAAFYREHAGRAGELFQAKTFSIGGKLKAEGTYVDSSLNIPHGNFVFYHPNGRVESRGAYVNGLKSGIWERFDAWGEPLAEKIYDPEPLANIIYTRAQTMPEFRGGGERAFVRYVKERVEANGDQVNGTITASFVVEKTGELSDVKVVESRGEIIDGRVVQAVKQTAPWQPGEEKGLPVRVQMRVPVQF